MTLRCNSPILDWLMHYPDHYKLGIEQRLPKAKNTRKEIIGFDSSKRQLASTKLAE